MPRAFNEETAILVNGRLRGNVALYIYENVLLERVECIDDQYGHLFSTPIRQVPTQGANYMPDCEEP